MLYPILFMDSAHSTASSIQSGANFADLGAQSSLKARNSNTAGVSNSCHRAVIYSRSRRISSASAIVRLFSGTTVESLNPCYWLPAPRRAQAVGVRCLEFHVIVSRCRCRSLGLRCRFGLWRGGGIAGVDPGLNAFFQAVGAVHPLDDLKDRLDRAAALELLQLRAGQFDHGQLALWRFLQGRHKAGESIPSGGTGLLPSGGFTAANGAGNLEPLL